MLTCNFQPRTSYTLKPFFIWFFLVIFFLNSAWALDQTIENMLKDGVGVRPLGMGGAFSALADDLNSIFYNPAGFALYRKFAYAKGYQDLNHKNHQVDEYDFFSIKSAGFGHTFRKNYAGNKQAEVFTYAYGQPSSNDVAWGVSYKTINYKIDGLEKLGYSLDLGLLGYASDNFQWAVVFKDIIKNSEVPASIRTGLYFTFLPRMVFTADFDFHQLRASDGPKIISYLGIENKVADGLSLRAGWYKNRLSGGFSAAMPFIIFEYALITSLPAENIESYQLFGFKLELK